MIKEIQRAVGIPIRMTGTMRTALELWRDLYESNPPLNAPWQIGDRVLPSNIPASIAEELAGLTLTEYSAEVTGGAAGTYINQEFQRETTGLDRKVELMCAFGGIVLRPYVSAGQDGKPAHIEVDFTDALHFYPTNFNSKDEIVGGLFVSHQRRGDRIYTRVEQQVLSGSTYTIRNWAFRSNVLIEGVDSISDAAYFAERAALDEVPDWAGLQDEFQIENLSEPLFAYVRMPKENKTDPSSPLGESAFAGAVNLIHEADVQLELISWEYRSKENKLLASTEMFHPKKKKEQTGPDDKFILPGLSRMFRLFPGERKKDESLIENYSPDIRDSSLWAGYNKYLRRIEYNCGLAYGMLSDPAETAKTATEVRSTQQRAYRNVSRIQDEWRKGLEHLVRSMAILGGLYQLCPAGEVELTCSFGDSVLEDTDREFTRLMTMQSAGLLSGEYVVSWYLGCSEEEAREHMPEQTDDSDPFGLNNA